MKNDELMKQVDCLCSVSYAKDWIESFPLGNGRIGVMDNGNPHESVITLNDDTLWSGYNEDKNKDTDENILNDIRTALDKHDYALAETLIHDNILSDWHDSYLPLCNVRIKRELGKDSVNDYMRMLDMSKALQEISFHVDNIAYKRTSFVSYVDKAFVMNITTSAKDTTEITVDSPLALSIETSLKEKSVSVFGKAPSRVAPKNHDEPVPVIYENDKKTISVYASLVLRTDGALEEINGGFKVIDYTYIRLYYSSATDFDMSVTPENYVRDVLAKVSGAKYDRLLSSHVVDFSKLYKKCSIKLDYKRNGGIITTENLLRRFASDDSYLEAVVNLFNLGRYLAISASRKGTQPMNLQGIWNNELRAPWCSNYTLNINTEMNYFGLDAVGLGECQEPLFEFIKRLSINGRDTAKRTFHCGGWVSGHNSDIWAHSSLVGGNNTPTSSCVYGFNVSSSGWLALQLFEHFEFTEDMQFLDGFAYPIMKEAARFYLDYLYKDSDTGYLVPSPSTSPENSFRIKFKTYSVNKASTMDVAVIKTLFKRMLVASEILKDDSPIIKEIENAIKELPPYRVGKRGELLEWFGNMKETDVHHRHMSHLFALHPSNEITPTKSAELAKACAVSLSKRGLSGTGWSIAEKINLYARLKDGNTAFELIKKQLTLLPPSTKPNMTRGGSYPNMLCAHPPFQIDGNMGAMAGIAEMLIQSHDNCVEFLPALPEKWTNGSFNGLAARGGYTVNLVWEDHKVKEFTVLSKYRKDVSVKIGNSYEVFRTNELIKLGE